MDYWKMLMEIIIAVFRRKKQAVPPAAITPPGDNSIKNIGGGQQAIQYGNGTINQTQVSAPKVEKVIERLSNLKELAKAVGDRDFRKLEDLIAAKSDWILDGMDICIPDDEKEVTYRSLMGNIVPQISSVEKKWGLVTELDASTASTIKKFISFTRWGNDIGDRANGLVRSIEAIKNLLVGLLP